MLCSAWTGARQGGRGLPGRPGAENGGPEIFLQKTLARQGQIRYIHFRAEVVELVDTLGSGSSSGNGVGVRLSPSAPMESKAGRNTSLFLFLGRAVFVPVRDDSRWQAAALPRLFSYAGQPSDGAGIPYPYSNRCRTKKERASFQKEEARFCSLCKARTELPGWIPQGACPFTAARWEQDPGARAPLS